MSKNSLTKADLHPLCLSKRPVTAVCYCQRAGVLTKLTCLVRIHQWHTAEKRPQCPVPSLGAHLLQIKRYVQRKRTPCVFIRLRLLQTLTEVAESPKASPFLLLPFDRHLRAFAICASDRLLPILSKRMSIQPPVFDSASQSSAMIIADDH